MSDTGISVSGSTYPESETSVNVTVGHTWAIVAGAVVILWLLGAFVFKTVRM